MTASRQRWTVLAWRDLCALALGLCLPMATIAQQQQQGVCAMVKIEIAQELALERIGLLTARRARQPHYWAAGLSGLFRGPGPAAVSDRERPGGAAGGGL